MFPERTDQAKLITPLNPNNLSVAEASPIPEQSERPRVDHLVELAHTLLNEVEILAGDKSFVDESRRREELNIAEGIDFFDEIKRFEISLIRLALAQTRGHQARAAKLLNINPTTLNTKIKLYGIVY